MTSRFDLFPDEICILKKKESSAFSLHDSEGVFFINLMQNTKFYPIKRSQGEIPKRKILLLDVFRKILICNTII